MAKSVFHKLSDIGVIWVSQEAAKLGYASGNSNWVNLGQGEPEVGELAGGVRRINKITIEPGDDRYGPLNGLLALRKAIAGHYNRLYRNNKSSKFTFENVSIAMGGRLALSRIFSTFAKIKLGYKIPEYPAYKDMLHYQANRVDPICVPVKKKNNFAIPSSELKSQIKKFDLDAFLISNPCNPTGHVIKETELQNYAKIARETKTTFIFDEVYSHFIYEKGKAAKQPVSVAEFIEDVNSDPILIVDALTKSFRYPGWRIAWIIASKEIITNLGHAASAIDGGASLPMQRAAIQLFDPKRADRESAALRKVFAKKQQAILKILRKNGIHCSEESSSTFYIWGDISDLPKPLNNAEVFFREALKHKVIVIPGYLFDIRNKSKKAKSDFQHHIRFSFGSDEKNLQIGLKRIEQLIQSFQNHAT